MMGGCLTPLPESDQPEALRQRMLSEAERQLQASGQPGALIPIERDPSRVETELTNDGLLDQIQDEYGPESYDRRPSNPGSSLNGSSAALQALTLEDAIRIAVEENLDVRIARLIPAVGRQQVIRAEAAFDAVFFADASLQVLDSPSSANSGSGQTRTNEIRTGLRQNLTSGGLLSLEYGYQDQKINNAFFGTTFTDFNTSDLTLQFTQPLLRGVGHEVNTANITLSRNQERSDIQELKSNLLTLVANVETAYWTLHFAHQRVKIQADLYENTYAEQERLRPRRNFDLDPAAWSDLVARTAGREADLTEAQEAVRRASRALKRLINDPNLPLTDARVLQPTDRPVDQQLSYSLHDAVSTALRERPEILQSILDIQDASVRQKVADNNRLPQLDLSAALRVQSIDDDDFGSLGNLSDLDFIDYIAQLSFEIPLGNRDAEALLGQRRLERQASVMAWQRQAQDVTLEVLDALDDVRLQYQLIERQNDAWLAAADSLRAIRAREEGGESLTSTFIAEKLNRMERLANAQLSYEQALVQYNTAVAEMYRSMGTLLERNRIGFETESY